MDLHVTAAFEPGRQRLAGPRGNLSISAPAAGGNLPGFFRSSAWTAALTCASLYRHRRTTTCFQGHWTPVAAKVAAFVLAHTSG